MALIGVLSSIFSYLKEKADPQRAVKLGKKIAFLTLIMAILNAVSPIIEKFQSDHLQHVPNGSFEENSLRLKEALTRSPLVEEVKTEIEKELQSAKKKS